jgi:predicted flap endonuclease-1-like 5' DNA nuclease
MDQLAYGAAVLCGVAVGASFGFLRGRRAGRSQPESSPDWKIRLRARDDELAAAEARAADVAVRLECISGELADARRRIATLEGGTGSHHGPPPSHPAGSRADDLTLVPGLGPREAAVLERSGITSYEALAGLGCDGAVVPEDIAEQLADRLSEWAAEARRLAGFRSDDPA